MKEQNFYAQDSCAPYSDQLLENMTVSRELAHKTGGRVMLVNTLEDNLVNGTAGKVVGYWYATGTKVEPDGKTRMPGSLPVTHWIEKN